MSPARETAFRVLELVRGGGYASDLLRQESPELAPRDAALAEIIVFGCLRYQSQLDYLIARFSGRPELKLDAAVGTALRMGIYQLRYLDRVPAHAAVAESVELVKRAHKQSAAGFVNAVLRRVNRQPVEWPDDAVRLSVPAWMLDRWRARYGIATAEGIARAALVEPAAYVNPATGRQQDLGSQSIVPLLALDPGMVLLDLCAAPGNKTTQALAAGARVIACDRYGRRLGEVPAAAERVVLDATDPLPFNSKFDRILIDAPCSGTGTLARNPEIKWRLRPEDLQTFQARQRRMLERALSYLKPDLKPGGRLVYSTCSLEPEENERAIDGLNVIETRLRVPGRDAGDGFFAAILAPST